MNILKGIIVILLVFIITMCSIISIYHIKKKKEYERCKYIADIIDTAYNKINEIQSESNYTFIRDGYICSLDGKLRKSKYTKLYKDGYYKEESITVDDVSYTNYGIQKDNECYFVQINSQNNNNIGPQGTAHINKDLHNAIYYYKRENVLDYCNYEIKTEIQNNIEYYVIKDNYDKNNTIWICKDNMILSKSESNELITTYTWENNNVTDEDVKIKNIDRYELNEYNNIY